MNYKINKIYKKENFKKKINWKNKKIQLNK